MASSQELNPSKEISNNSGSTGPGPLWILWRCLLLEVHHGSFPSLKRFAITSLLEKPLDDICIVCGDGARCSLWAMPARFHWVVLRGVRGLLSIWSVETDLQFPRWIRLAVSGPEIPVNHVSCIFSPARTYPDFHRHSAILRSGRLFPL